MISQARLRTLLFGVWGTVCTTSLDEFRRVRLGPCKCSLGELMPYIYMMLASVPRALMPLAWLLPAKRWQWHDGCVRDRWLLLLCLLYDGRSQVWFHPQLLVVSDSFIVGLFRQNKLHGFCIRVGNFECFHFLVWYVCSSVGSSCHCTNSGVCWQQISRLSPATPWLWCGSNKLCTVF